jgi:eukaryotic-like serine/threonine-protein kinase
MLTPGTRLGPYEIVAPIGAGGMGEVYRARDTRLDRAVAVKILPAEFAQNAQFKIRFDREARMIAQLSHPHICTLFDVGENYIVMELLDGESLADRLSKVPLPLPEVLKYGPQIAGALGKAHRAGIIHRDLKPGNIMLTKGGAKLLDFGLAKSTAPALVPDDLTVQKPLTQEGTILGTFQYMAPEQLAGEEPDARTDIFALGCVLYEMATGKRAFEGKTKASLIAAIVSGEPVAMTLIQPLTPPALEHVVRKCLAKDRDDRWQSAIDVAEELRWISEAGSGAGIAAPLTMKRQVRERLAWSIAAVMALSAITFAAGFLVRAPRPAAVVHFSIETPEKTSLFPFDEHGIALSPDGLRLVFVAASANGGRILYLRALNKNSSQPLAGTGDASYPFWSPDGQFIGFFAGGKLKKIASGGGPPQVICDAQSGRGGTWNQEGVIVFTPTIQSALFRVSVSGGTPIQVSSLAGGEGRFHRWPFFLPDGKHFLFVGVNDLHVGSLDSHETTTLIRDASNAAFAAPDHLVFSRGEILMTQEFDPRKLRVDGEPVPLSFGSVSNWVPKRLSIFSVARNGTLAFLPAQTFVSRIVWIDRNGREVGSVGEPDRYTDVALSPDGKKIAVIKGGPTDGDIWLVDIADGRWSRFTFQPGQYGSLTWNRDASLLAFSQAGQLYVKPLSRDADSTPIVRTKEWTAPLSFSPDGRVLLIYRQMPGTGADIYSVTMDGKATMQPVVQTPFDETRARFSPDGKWFAYESSDSGATEVYVRRYPPTADQRQVSVNGGASALWRPDGRELYYLGSKSLMAVPIRTADGFNPGTAVPLFRTTGEFFSSPLSSGGLSAGGIFGGFLRGVTPDGQTFLLRSTGDERPVSLNVVLNWQSAISK